MKALFVVMATVLALGAARAGTQSVTINDANTNPPNRVRNSVVDFTGVTVIGLPSTTLALGQNATSALVFHDGILDFSVPVNSANGLLELDANKTLYANVGFITDTAANISAYPTSTFQNGMLALTTDSHAIIFQVGGAQYTVNAGGTTWGSITGTLSNQTDLQTALNAKQGTLTLTTTGTSGAATLSGGTLNIPQYGGGGVTSFNTRTGAVTLSPSDLALSGAALTALPTNPSLYPTLNQSTTGTAAFATNSGTATFATQSGTSTYSTTTATGTTSSTAAAGNDSRITGALQSANNLNDIHNGPLAASYLGLPTLIGPSGMNFVAIGDSMTEGLFGTFAGAPQNYPAVVQAGPWGAGGSLVYAMGFSQETTAMIAGHYSQSSVSTTITTTANSTSATVASASGISTGYAIAFLGSVPGTTVTAISGTTVTLSKAATSSQSGVACAVSSVPTGVFYGGLYGGGAANGWMNFSGTPHGLSYAISGRPTLDFLFCGNNDYFEFAPTVNTTNGSTSATLNLTTGNLPYSIVGATIVSANIPANTTITASSGTSITLSSPATATASSTASTVNFLITGTLANGSNQITGITGAYSLIAHGNMITGTGLPSGNQALYVMSGQGTTTLTLSGNATASGTVTLTVHLPTTQLDTWTTAYQGLVTACHNDGNTVANGGGVIITAINPCGNAVRAGVGDAFRSLFNSVIAGGTLGQDYTFNCNAQFPTDVQLAASGGAPYFSTIDNIHFAATGAALFGQQLGQFALNITKTTNTGGWAAPGIGTLLGTSHTIYVSQGFGSDTRVGLTQYSIYSPFATIKAAMAQAVSGDTIALLDGAFTDSLTWTSGVSVLMYPGTSWIAPNAIIDNGATITGTLACLGGTVGDATTTSMFCSLTGTNTSFTMSNVNGSVTGSGSEFVYTSGPGASLNISGNVKSTCQVVQMNGANSSLVYNGNATMTTGYNYAAAIEFLYGGGSPNCVINGNVSYTGSTAYTYALGPNNSGTYTINGVVSAPSAPNGAIYNDGGTPAITITSLSEGTPSSFPSGSTINIGNVTAPKAVAGSTSGTATFNESVITPNNKQVNIFLNALTGTATFTLPKSFANTPVVMATSGLATTKVTSASTTSLQVTGSGDTGQLIVGGN